MKLDRTHLVNQLNSLIQEKQFNSAEILGNFLISDKNVTPSAELLALFADILMEKDQIHRAINYYEKALGLSRPLRRVSRTVTKIACVDEDENFSFGIKFKIIQCLFTLKKTREAINMFADIPQVQRNVKMNIFMGKAYQEYGNTKQAKECFKEAVKQNGMALEAVFELVKMGASQSELRILYSGQTNSPLDWLDPVIGACVQQAKHDLNGAIESFEVLEKVYPNNIFLLGRRGKCEALKGRNDESLRTFERMRSVDQNTIDSMGIYAQALKNKGELLKLNQLCSNLITKNPNHCDTWIATALYWDMKGDKNKAVSLLDQALALNENNEKALQIKGDIMMSVNAFEQATDLYRKSYLAAQNFGETNILHFSTQVQSLISHDGRIKEALNIAKESQKILKCCAESYSLIGMVLSVPTNADIRKKARECFTEAIKADKNCLDAIIGLAHLEKATSKPKEALALLEEACNRFPSRESVHIRMGVFLMGEGKHNEALNKFNMVLGMNKYNEEAKMGIEAVEKILKGGDKQEEEEEEEEEQMNE